MSIMCMKVCELSFVAIDEHRPRHVAIWTVAIPPPHSVARFT